MYNDPNGRGRGRDRFGWSLPESMDETMHDEPLAEASSEVEDETRNPLLRWWGALTIPQREGYGLGAICICGFSLWATMIVARHPEWQSFQDAFMILGVIVCVLAGLASAMLMSRTTMQRVVSGVILVGLGIILSG
jgi:hypothetical protein